MIALILALVVIGCALFLIKTYIPMDPAISTLITVVVVLCCVAWLLGVFGVVDIPVPHVRR